MEKDAYWYFAKTTRIDYIGKCRNYFFPEDNKVLIHKNDLLSLKEKTEKCIEKGVNISNIIDIHGCIPEMYILKEIPKGDPISKKNLIKIDHNTYTEKDHMIASKFIKDAIAMETQKLYFNCEPYSVYYDKKGGYIFLDMDSKNIDTREIEFKRYIYFFNIAFNYLFCYLDSLPNQELYFKKAFYTILVELERQLPEFKKYEKILLRSNNYTKDLSKVYGYNIQITEDENNLIETIINDAITKSIDEIDNQLKTSEVEQNNSYLKYLDNTINELANFNMYDKTSKSAVNYVNKRYQDIIKENFYNNPNDKNNARLYRKLRKQELDKIRYYNNSDIDKIICQEVNNAVRVRKK